jgi:parvulin-like peptidyl-prolyl isomerase
MSKRIILSLFLALILALGCLPGMAEEAPDPETTVVVSINGEAILLRDVIPQYRQYAAQYQAYGMDLSDQNVSQQLFSLVVNNLMQEKLIRQKAAELGLDQYGEELEAQWLETATKNYESLLQMYMASQTEEGMSEEEKRTAAVAMLENSGYSLDVALKSLKDKELFRRVHAYAVEGVSIPEDAVRNAYDEGVAQAKERYAENPAAFGSEVQTGSIIYYTPEGYRTVKHILVKCDEAAELKELMGKVAELQEGEEGYAEAKARIDEIMAGVQPKLDEIMGRIEAGEDFQGLIDAYGEDTGMKSGPAAETGYYMCKDTTTYVPEFTEGGMALEAEGDVSPPILTNFGFHIIRLHSLVAPGETEFEEIREQIREQLLSEAQDAAYTAKIQEWAEEAVVEYPKA